MRFFVKAVATGFAMSMGSALFKKVSEKMGLEGESAEKAPVDTPTEVVSEDDAPETDSR